MTAIAGSSKVFRNSEYTIANENGNNISSPYTTQTGGTPNQIPLRLPTTIFKSSVSNSDNYKNSYYVSLTNNNLFRYPTRIL